MHERATLVMVGVRPGTAHSWAPCNRRDKDRSDKVGEEVEQPHQGKKLHLEPPQTLCYAARVSFSAAVAAVEVDATPGPGAVHWGDGLQQS